jgi:hypothetical protein
MDCSCIRRSGPRFDFHLELIDCDTFIFTDLSNWMEEDYYVVPEEYPMTIKMPNGTTKVINFKPKGSVVITSSTLGAVILDGVYCFTTESCGYTYTRSEAILCGLECKLDTLIASLDPTNFQDISRIHSLHIYMEAIRTNAKLDKPQLAESFFKIVQRELQKVDCL